MLLHVDLEDFVKQISLTKVEMMPAGSCQLLQTFFFKSSRKDWKFIPWQPNVACACAPSDIALY